MKFSSVSELTARQRKIIRAWCMYDWANSAFATSGGTAIFPVYFVFAFNESLGESARFLGMTFTGSSTWSVGIAISTAFVALTSPALGVIADRVAIKKALLWTYTIVGSVFTVLAFFSAYTAQPWAWLFGTFLLANVGFAGGLVFYNAFLPHIAPRELLDDVSSRGFAYGYVGGGLLLVVHLAAIFITQDTDIADLVTRVSIASVGFWWFGWAVWTLKVVPEPTILDPAEGLTLTRSASLAFRGLARTFRQMRGFKAILVYLAAYLLFNDGIQTVTSIAGAYAADTIRLPLIFNMATILIIQFVAAGGAMAFARLAGLISTKGALGVSLVGWSLIVLFGVAIIPLVPSEHGQFDYQIAQRADAAGYVVEAAPELGDSPADKLWEREILAIDAEFGEGSVLGMRQAERLLERAGDSENSAYSVSASGGALDGQASIGSLHPSNLGEGPIDWWPIMVRDKIWEPLGMDAGYQWLTLGLCVGLVLGGSQALARSLFAQIMPETRSAEFFSFFGFMSRVSSVFGPILYVFATSVYDTRVAVASILIMLISGAIVLRWVNVEEGAEAAAAEDARARARELDRQSMRA